MRPLTPGSAIDRTNVSGSVACCAHRKADGTSSVANAAARVSGFIWTLYYLSELQADSDLEATRVGAVGLRAIVVRHAEVGSFGEHDRRREGRIDGRCRGVVARRAKAVEVLAVEHVESLAQHLDRGLPDLRDLRDPQIEAIVGVAVRAVALRVRRDVPIAAAALSVQTAEPEVLRA